MLTVGRVLVTIGLLLLVAWLIRDAWGRTFARPWLPRAIVAMLASFAAMSTLRLAVMRFPALARAEAVVFDLVGVLALTIGVGVWVPTLRAWWRR